CFQDFKHGISKRLCRRSLVSSAIRIRCRCRRSRRSR
ncbi:MAG: hypothetical protein AVDCRST_MAG26-715, partial [uncultured Chloroflexia bacterium]